MKVIYLKNFRKGFATNSSSTHSLIYRNKDEMFEDMNIFELDYYDRCDSTIAASKKAKIKYIAAYCYWNKFLFEVMCKYYPEMEQYIPLIKEQEKSNKEKTYKNIFGMHTRGAFITPGQENVEFNIKTLCNIIDNDDIIIVGGSDEQDFVYDTCENHKEVTTADDINNKYAVVKNGNYWVGINEWRGNRIRFNQKPEDCVPEYPELIDLKITNQCEHRCPFCYMSSDTTGKHADISFLNQVIENVSSNEYSEHKTRVEFAIGGGNILLYPHLEDLFKHLKERGHIINTTINVKDVPKICKDAEFKYCIDENTGNENGLFNLFDTYVKGLGISINDEKDLVILRDHDINEILKNCKVTLHIIPELIGAKKARSIINKAYKMKYYNVLLLGYKTNNRGATQKHSVLNDKDLHELLDDVYNIGVDTTFANRYKDWIKKNFDTNVTITWNEGEYSMYIDGVTENAYKSSYQLDKPYNLSYGNYTEEDKTWFRVKTAFKHIREDNGFETYKED